MTTKKIDRRVQRTRQFLQAALIRLILEKGYDKITVQHIIDEANVGRSTFYAHYLDKDDLMVGSLQKLHEELHQYIERGDTQSTTLDMLSLFQHTQEKHDLYKALLGGRGIDIVVDALNSSLIEYASTYFRQIEQQNDPFSIPTTVLATYLAGTLQTLLRWWLDNDMPYSAEKMNTIFMQLVTGGIDSTMPNGKG